MVKRFLTLVVPFLSMVSLGFTQAVSPNPMQWHKLTVTYTSDELYTEEGNPNPFTERRLDVVFSKGSQSYRVPGYFAADGDAGNTGASSGKIWKAHFAPPEAGEWSFKGAFYQGTDVHALANPTNPTKSFEGTFTVSPTNKSATGKDLRGKGWLQYVEKRYLQFKGTGEYFIKQGPDSPENLFAFKDFDGDFKTDGIDDNKIKAFDTHLADWKTGDPTWAGSKGKGIIGVINYLASEGLNAFSFVSMSIKADDENTFPFVKITAFDRIDVSRMDQWEVVFAHATTLGFFIHFKTQETENECLQDNCEVGRERKLYYRELIARFSHNPALNWNLGEENGAYDGPNQVTSQRRAMAAYFWENDPYNHHIVLHNPISPDDMYGTESKLTGWSYQSGSSWTAIPSSIKNIVDKSAASGKQWAVAADETGGASSGINPDNSPTNHAEARKYGIWATLLVGSFGNEWYMGGQDQSLQDFRTRDKWWDYCRYTIEFFQKNKIPLWEMSNDDAATSSSEDRVLSKKGQVYLIGLPNGGTTNLNVTGLMGSLDIKWYNPRQGGDLLEGSVKSLNGSGSIGNPPNETDQDWVVLVGANKLTSINKPYSMRKSGHKINLQWGVGKILRGNLELQNPGSQIQVSLHTLHGYQIAMQPIYTQHKQVSEFSMDLSAFTSGLYMIKIFAGNQEIAQKIVVP